MPRFQVEIVFFEDFTLTVDALLSGPDPQVGLMDAYVEEWDIIAVDGTNIAVVNTFFYMKISNNKNYNSTFEALVAEAVHEAAIDAHADAEEYKAEMRRERHY